jgi:hypothetical protein
MRTRAMTALGLPTRLANRMIERDRHESTHKGSDRF